MKQIKRLVRFARIVRYQFSTDKKCLNYFLNKMRDLDPLTDSEVSRFKILAEERKRIYA